MQRVCVLFGGMVIAAAVLAGCRVDTRVDITLNHDGSGTLRTTMTVDAEAATRLGQTPALTASVPADDLRAAGWTVSGWKPVPGGARSITFTHGFKNQADLEARITDLAGRNGILQNAAITRNRDWLSSTDGVAVVVDLRTPSAGLLTDAGLAARLKAAGLDPAILERDLAQELRDALHVSLTVHLPDGETKSFDAVTGKVTTFRVDHERTQWDHVVQLGLALSLGLLAALFISAASVGRRRELRRRRQRASAEPIAAERAPLM